uniref:G domain-containing protein n=1 Tax=Cyprinodon variegatus TaxID=28743 RepID=A0A3Q2DGZ1_CYPVA
MVVFLNRDRETDLQFIKDYKPTADDQQKFRILLHGLVGAGKSSLICSILSVLEGRVRVRAAVCNIGQDSFTKEVNRKYFSLIRTKGEMYPIVLNDMMGMETSNRRHRRVYVRNVEMALQGHIMDGYTFNCEKCLSKTDQFYNKTPTVNDQVHVLVSVIDADKINLLGNSTLEKFQDMRDDATDQGIPNVVILTKIDELCPETQKDLKNVCRSRLIKQKVNYFFKMLGIPENFIFPVKNYCTERSLDKDMNALLLNTLRRIIEIGEEHLTNKRM